MKYNRKADNGELEFTRAADEVLRDAREEYGLDHRLQIHSSDQRGVLAFHLSGRKRETPDQKVPSVNVVAYWPSSTPESFGAFMFQLTMKYSLMAMMWKQEEINRHR